MLIGKQARIIGGPNEGVVGEVKEARAAFFGIIPDAYSMEKFNLEAGSLVWIHNGNIRELDGTGLAAVQAERAKEKQRREASELETKELEEKEYAGRVGASYGRELEEEDKRHEVNLRAMASPPSPKIEELTGRTLAEGNGNGRDASGMTQLMRDLDQARKERDEARAVAHAMARYIMSLLGRFDAT